VGSFQQFSCAAQLRGTLAADPPPATPALDAAGSQTITKGLRVIELKAQVEHPLREEVGERAVWARFSGSRRLCRIEFWLNSVNSDSDRLRCSLQPPSRALSLVRTIHGLHEN
jgi:hypothetical protein